MGGIALQQTNLTSRGLEHDRCWMLTDLSGRFITQREWPRMCLFTLQQTNEGFVVRADGNEQLIPFYQEAGETVTVEVFDTPMTALAASTDLSTWFSEQMGMPCRLVKHSDITQRQVDLQYALPGEQTTFSDGYPVLFIGESALQELNHRLEEPLSINRFRPNIVFSGGNAHVEDTWKGITINTTQLRGVKPCGRCVVTTINQATGEKGIEPLRTLATYRQKENKILFGQNAVVVKPGFIRVGDFIEA